MHIKIRLTLLLLLVPLFIRATGLLGDIIYLNGEQWELMEKPIHTDSILYKRLRKFLPENHCVSTANWDGYTAFWEIRNGYLCLQHLEVCVYDKETNEDSVLTFNPDTLKTLFAPYYEGGEICARWFSGEVRAGQGKTIRYYHDGFDRNMETEQVMLIKQGKVVQSDLYHNYETAGLNFKSIREEIVKRFPWDQFPELKGQRLFFSMGDLQITDDGKLSDLDLSIILLKPYGKSIDDSNHPLIKAAKKTLQSIYPWGVFYINGKRRMEFTYVMMPIGEKQSQTPPTE